LYKLSKIWENLRKHFFYLVDCSKFVPSLKNKSMTNNEQKLSEILDNQYDQESEKIFQHIVEMGVAAFQKTSPLFKYKDTDLLNKLIEHFESKEEYEKCAKLQKVQWCLKASE